MGNIYKWALLLNILALPVILFAQETKPLLRYEGSSTLANFIRDAESVYGEASFIINDETESDGGEKAIIEGRVDIAGVARVPKAEVLGTGVFSTLIGWDAIAVIANNGNSVTNLSKKQLKDIFTGKIKNWKELGGTDLEIHPYIVDFESATRKVFRSVILGQEDYKGCEIVSPDVDMIKKVKNDPGAIGHISLSFLNTPEFLHSTSLKTIAVEGQEPLLTNSNYPITRPLFLLWWSRERVENFINWINTPEGQSVVQRNFITPGTRGGDNKDVPTIEYIGSSTVGIFIQNASSVYRKVKFNLNTQMESIGGEQSIVEGKAQLVGIAKLPETTTLQSGVVSTLIARDAITVIVSKNNKVKNLSLEQLRAIFTGRITNWKELGGADQPIKPLVVGEESATRSVFQQKVLNRDNYSGCFEIKPDPAIISAVADNPGAIGHISMAFLNKQDNVRPLAIEGQIPTVSNIDYPITRPLYLLYKEGNTFIENFVEWTHSIEAQRIIMKHFIGSWVVGTTEGSEESGTLIVYTETFPVEDGGVYYYPHQSYDILTPDGELIKRVHNRLSPNDETPTHVQLPPGSYLIRPEGFTDKQKEFFVNIEAEKTTKVYVDELKKSKVSKADQVPEQLTERDKQIADIVGRFKALQLYGDFRFRAEQDYDSRKTNGSYRDNRSRLRYRVRFGFTYKWGEHISFGARIRTGVPENFQSPHNNLGYNGSASISFNLDKAYLAGRYKNSWWWVGKNSFPFWKQNELFWDDDVTPAGIAAGTSFSIKKIKFNPKVAYLISNNFSYSNGGIDGTITAGQLELNYNRNKTGITLASSYYQMDNIDNVPETDNFFTGTRYKLDYKIIVSGLKLSYNAKYPIAVGFDHFINLEDYSSDTLMNNVYKDQKKAFVASVQMGQLKDKGDWLIGYYYTRKEELSVVSYYTEDDWVRWGNINRNRNTNYAGHEIRLAYAFGSQFNVVTRTYFVEGLVTTKTHTETGSRFRVDFNIKF